MFGVSAMYAAGCAVALRRLAERARRNAIDELTRLWIRARGQAALAPLAGQVELLLGEIKGLRKGTFAPLLEQPVVRAVLLPFTSAGGLAVIQHLGWLGW